MKFPPFLHSHLRLTLLGTPPNRVFFGGEKGMFLTATAQRTLVVNLQPCFDATSHLAIP
jgi:hypothetical protein